MKHREMPGFRKIVSPKDQEIQLIPVEGRAENPKTIKDLLELYKCTIKPADFSATLSTLTRYTVPALSGPSPKSSRASSEEIEAALKFLEKKSIWLLEQLEEYQEKYFEKVKLPANKRYLPRTILKKLIDWARKQGFLTPKAPNQGTVLRSFLRKEMNQAFATSNRDISAILRFLEFLYREKYQHKLDQLSLTSIIPDLPTPDSIKIHQFRAEAHPGDALLIAKSSAEEEMTKAISQMEETISTYLDSLTVTFESQVNYLKSFVNLGKFIYFKQTKYFAREGGYEDIDLIKSLRKIQSQKAEESVTSGQKTESRKRQREKMVPWPTILLAVELAVIKSGQKYKYGVNTKTRYKNGSPRISMAIRSERAQFHDFQNALILAMATALPPSRSKVYYQMEIGKNLFKGKLINGVLVRQENLPENQKDLATWWLCLSPSDGKKDTIGEEGWQAEIPNRQFSTGKTLYWYLEEWINNWRPKLNPQHNYLYLTEEGKELTSATYGNKVRNAFRRFIGIPINPHLLRHILITYAYERGMTDVEKRSLAICQQHSEETQARIYNEQEMLNRLQPALQLNQKFLDEFYQSFDPNQIDPS